MLYDLEPLVDDSGRRLAAFGYWAGFAGAAVSLKAFAAQKTGLCSAAARYGNRAAMVADVVSDLGDARPPVIVIGAKGRVGTGAGDMCRATGLQMIEWDMAETAHGGPFPEVLAHEVFLNCILANPGCPMFVPSDAGPSPRALRVIGDIACDPTGDFSPSQGLRPGDRLESPHLACPFRPAAGRDGHRQPAFAFADRGARGLRRPASARVAAIG